MSLWERAQPGASADERWMRRAVQRALSARGDSEPNPPVGCVLVSADGQLIGEGCTAPYGGPHAEVNAVNDALARGHRLAGATAYVTLEPCAHHGKTPPCADLLVKHQIARVVAAMTDPFEQVAGRGFDRLQAAGVEVMVGVGAALAAQANAPFVKRVTTGLPYIICKWAQTVDGKIATACGHSQWISNAASRRRVHELRARVDAVVVGVGTALADDPMLTARGVDVRRTARRVVIDPNLRCTPRLKLFAEPGPPVTLAVSADAMDDAHPLVRSVRERDGDICVLNERAGDRFALTPLMKHLADTHQATNVMVEGGAVVHGTLFNEGLVDEAQVYVAPKLIGSDKAPAAVRLSRVVDRMDHAQTMTLVASEVIEGDVLLTYLANGQ